MYLYVVIADLTASLPVEQQAGSIWTQLKSTVNLALNLPYDSVLPPQSSPSSPTDVIQIPNAIPLPAPTLPPDPPHSPPKPRKPRTHIPDIHTLPLFKEIRLAQRVFSWKENDTMIFPTSFSSQNLVLGNKPTAELAICNE